ncbi:hypothetical protein HJC23_013529 [Cyclotella cryptica]|uniref:Sulfotransferase domain-containing protein n=1 Tax=Cyclotella cryptica TaxID=29204 RepID=A0ABD3P856_9STRA|eukprot:CCRYP_016676-RA/>CCRYP_016676-RA protein AED:0.04 eAED:0.04 QI:219/1/1/1/1/1/4/1710/531
MPQHNARDQRRHLPHGRFAAVLLKVSLIACTMLSVWRNLTLHNLASQSVMEDQRQYERTSRESFVTGSARKTTNAVRRKIGHVDRVATFIASTENTPHSQWNHHDDNNNNNDDEEQIETAVVPTNFSRLPLALQPVTFQNCCPMMHRPTKKPRCGEVCLTRHACNNNTLYPYTSSQERHFLRPRSEENRDILRRQCHERNSLSTPPYQWCQQWWTDSIMHVHRRRDDTENATTITTTSRLDPYAANLPPPGCSIFNNGGGSGSYQHLILFPSVKMAFCGIPKVGITQWIQFLRFTFGAKDYLSSPHIKPEVFAMRYDKMNEEAQMKILNDPEWKFVAFLRDPAERLLSAYLDKVATKQLERDHFQKMHGLNRTLSFGEFLNILAETPPSQSCRSGGGNDLNTLRGVNWCTNPHWRPQTFSCGLSEFLPRFSFVGSLNFIETQARIILQHVGLWNDYGKWYHWHTKKNAGGSSRCNSAPPSLIVGQRLFGFQQTPKESGLGSGGLVVAVVLAMIRYVRPIRDMDMPRTRVPK